jgi:multidrug efflux pump subunit AcrA (membrane-fusion protein)
MPNPEFDISSDGPSPAGMAKFRRQLGVRYPAPLGVDAVVRVPEIPDHTFPGEVARIADALDPATRTLTTEIDVPNPTAKTAP